MRSQPNVLENENSDNASSSAETSIDEPINPELEKNYVTASNPRVGLIGLF